MTAVLSYTEADALEALRGLILTVTPGIEVIRAQANRVPEPKGSDFVLMTVVLRTRLTLNVDYVQDVVFAGSITGTTLTYDPPSRGDLRAGTAIWGVPAVAVGTEVVSVDGFATATVTPAQTAPYGLLYAGYKFARQEAELHVQLDVHGLASGDNVVKLATLLRDGSATQWFDDSGLDLNALYAGDPRQVPFINAEAQWENRWTLDVALQANQVVQVPQQFADQLHTDFIEVDAVYPP